MGTDRDKTSRIISKRPLDFIIDIIRRDLINKKRRKRTKTPLIT